MHLSPIARFAISTRSMGETVSKAINAHNTACTRTVDTLSNLNILAIRNATIGSVVDIVI